ncbi:MULTISPECIES: hypothetical protein [Acidobacteriaceae]|uniref:hypothetical protein n=1 Tax=Acidobacteriaceae TaxID=204434 RepID=UPI00131C112C|nr:MULTISPECIES: hypothetical protein [Acidobacteriaceae]MDW5265067.1 hypothetical protein [Edaphobacter sp.]
MLATLEVGNKTKEQIRAEFIAHFYPHLSYSDAKSKSGFNVFFSDSKRPIGTYHASRSLLICKDEQSRLSLNPERSELVKAAISGGILDKIRGLHFPQDKAKMDVILAGFDLPTEANRPGRLNESTGIQGPSLAD